MHPIFQGEVDWSGENPGIYLKEDPNGPWSGLMCFYRVVYSPHGMGSGVVVLDEPNVAKGRPDVDNFCICDNEELARYLVAEFFSNFAAFKVSPGIGAISYLPLTGLRREGDTRTACSEIINSNDLEVRLNWEGLSDRYAVNMPAELGPTKQHDMLSFFIDAQQASVTINGRPLRGKLVTRNCGGETKSSAFLAFSETWIKRAD